MRDRGSSRASAEVVIAVATEPSVEETNPVSPEEEPAPKKRRKKCIMATQGMSELDAMRAYYLSVVMPFVVMDASIPTRLIGLRLRVPVDTRVTFVQKNPKAPNSKSYERYEKYKEATTIEQVYLMGCTNADLEWDVYHRHATLQKRDSSSHPSVSL